MTKFEVGKVYEMTSICNQDCVWSYVVVGRTESTITLKDLVTETVKRCRVNKYLTETSGCESVYPLGRYSMCPILRA